MWLHLYGVSRTDNSVGTDGGECFPGAEGHGQIGARPRGSRTPFGTMKESNVDAVSIVKLYDSTKSYWVVQFIWVNCMVCEQCLNKSFKNSMKTVMKFNQSDDAQVSQMSLLKSGLGQKPRCGLSSTHWNRTVACTANMLCPLMPPTEPVDLWKLQHCVDFQSCNRTYLGTNIILFDSLSLPSTV